mgnify:CR=1 FL=1
MSIHEYDFLDPKNFNLNNSPSESTEDINDGLNHLAKSGFVVLKNAIDTNIIKQLSDVFYSDILNSQNRLPRIQGYRVLEKNNFTCHGHMSNALMNMQLENPASFSDKENQLTNLVLQLITDGKHIELIKHALGYEKLEILTWNLFHSVSPCTPPHQDCVFFNPAIGLLELLGVWIALEDIDSQASPLYVQRGSHIYLRRQTKEFKSITPHYRNFFRENLKSNLNDIAIPMLKAGDCIIWDARTVHGSLIKTDPTASRLSITAHFTGRDTSLISKLFKMNSKNAVSRAKKRFIDSLQIKKCETSQNITFLSHRNRFQ